MPARNSYHGGVPNPRRGPAVVGTFLLASFGMLKRSSPVIAVAILCLAAETIHAHGGQYRGPGTTRGPGVSPGSRGGTGPVTGGASADHRYSPDVTRWQVWWELNKDAYLRAPRLAVDPRSPQSARDAIPLKVKIDVIVPALKKALDSTSNQHLTSACLIALGKIGIDLPTFKLLEECKKRLRRGNQEIREVAALAMGISKRPEAIPILAALLQDTTAGRRMMGRESVGFRTRTFSAYGLGLIARGNNDVKVKTRVLEALEPLLRDKNMRKRDILIGVLNGFRLIDPRPSQGASHRRLLWKCLQTLEDYQMQRFGKSREAIQAHAATAMGRLLGRRTTADHTRVKGLFEEMIRNRRRRHQTFYQSSAIALGQMLLPPEEYPDDGKPLVTLHKQYDKSRDKLTRYFALISMGQIGGQTNFEKLVKAFKHGKTDQKGWAAIGLGLLAFHTPKTKAGTPQKTGVVSMGDRVGKLLLKPLWNTANRDVRAAISLALGLCDYKPAAAELRRMLKRYRKVEEFAGYICIGLALMDDKASGKLINEVMGESSRRPLLMAQAAMALAKLRHPGAGMTLRNALRNSSSRRTLTLAATSMAMGYLADPDNVQPMVNTLLNKGNNKLVRAFAAVALGSMAENDPLTWSAWIAMNMNYTSTVETLTNGSSGILDIL